jgi:hypothetical protein
MSLIKKNNKYIINTKRINLLYTQLFILIVCLHTNFSFAQNRFLDSIKQIYPFIDTNFISIQNAPALTNFFNLLYLQEINKNQVINVSHIGDSHIQADFFSGKLRIELQKKFGNGGRGLIFPYRVAKTNEPWNIRTQGTGIWESKRCVFYEKPLPIGVSGITLKCSDTLAEITVTTNDQQNLDYRFNNLTLFHQKGAEYYDIMVLDEQNNIRGFINSNLMYPTPYISNCLLDSLFHTIKLKSYKRDSSNQHLIQIYGIYLKNNQPGVIYNTIGVNGAEYLHYNKADLFIEQFKYLNSQLVIISLGTNDLLPPNPDINHILANIDTLITSINKENPYANILITTPGDFLRKRKIKNKHIEIFNKKLYDYCTTNHIAFWDWYNIMGGMGSVISFNKKGLAQADKLHLTRAGYELQGELLFYALMQAYTTYKNQKP